MSFTNITPRHMELLAAVVKNLKSTDVDWETVATDANYKTAKYARDEYKKAREKLQGAAAAGKDKEDGGAKEASEKGGAKKRKAAADKTPAKGKKGKKVAKECVQLEPEPEQEDDEDGDGDVLK